MCAISNDTLMTSTLKTLRQPSKQLLSAAVVLTQLALCVLQMAYNFIYSLGQHSYDADCNLFLRIFTGEA